MTEKRPYTLRLVTPEDAAALVEIYAPYVTATAVSFEYEPPTVEEFRGRIERVLERFPYLAAVQGEKVLGYAYAAPYGVRKAYGWAVELSVYVREDCRGLGIGRSLYETMEQLLQAQQITNLYTLIASVDGEDPYLTQASLKFHGAMGYQTVGKLHKAGYKFGRWYDMVTMEKFIGEHLEGCQPPVISLRELDPQVLTAAGLSEGGALHDTMLQEGNKFDFL